MKSKNDHIRGMITGEINEPVLTNELNQSETRLRTLVQTIPDLIWLKTSEGVYLSCNIMFERFFGAKESEIVGKTDYDFVDRELANFFRENDRKAMDAGKPTSNEEWITFADDGHRAYLETIKAPMYDAQNKLIGILGIGRDITEHKKSEIALKISEEKFRSYIDNAPDGIFVVNEKGKYIDVNNAACKMCGYSQEELLNMSISDILAPESYKNGMEQFLELSKLGTLKTDLLHRMKDGSKRWLSLDAVKLSENRFLGFTKDITDRKLAEEEIIMLSHSLKSVNECVSITDMHDILIFVNESFLKTYGYSMTELIGKHISIVRSQNNSSELVSEILPGTIRGEWVGELWNSKKDGTEFQINLSTSVIKDKENRILGLIGVATDISGRKRSEELLRESNERMRITLEETQIGTFDWDIKGDLFYVSATYYTMLGYEPREGPANRHEWFSLVHPDDKHLISEKIDNAINGIESNYCYEVRFQHADGSWRWIYVKGHTIRWDENHKPVRMIGVRIDVTERKLAEKELIDSKERAEESDRLKSTFLANMSHEIRTPMNGIVGFTELLNSKDLTEEERMDCFNSIGKSGMRMLTLIENIVSISKVESGQSVVHISDTNVNELISEVYDFNKAEAEQKNLHLICKKSMPVSDMAIKTDRDKVFTILTNLVNNAIKFTSNGFIEFGYVIKDSFLEFFVKDTGIGVHKEKAEIIFERFRQGSELLNRNYEGAGLGLAISKAYAEMLGGKIRVISEPQTISQSVITEEKGSTFIFTIPYNPVHSPLVFTI